MQAKTSRTRVLLLQVPHVFEQWECQLVVGMRGGAGSVVMHIKLSTPRKLLWHYRVAIATIMPASKELPYDDNTTGGPCYA